jgi:very-short-patch-repair endonuclease
MNEIADIVLKISIPIILIAITLVVIRSFIKNKRGKEIWPYYAKKPITKTELILYYRLVNALPDKIILSQVQLSRVLGVKKGNNFGEWNNRINRMSLDFVVCRKEDAGIIAVIELDDKSHEKEERIKADEKKDKALESANIRIIRWKVDEMPDEKTIKRILSET